jgi:hypothetical protein
MITGLMTIRLSLLVSPVLSDLGRITSKVFVDQAHVAVVGVARAVAVVAEVEELGEFGHHRVRMIIVKRVGVGPTRSSTWEDEFRSGRWMDFRLFHGPSILLRSGHERPTPRSDRSRKNQITLPRSGLVQQRGG